MLRNCGRISIQFLLYKVIGQVVIGGVEEGGGGGGREGSMTLGKNKEYHVLWPPSCSHEKEKKGGERKKGGKP